MSSGNEPALSVAFGGSCRHSVRAGPFTISEVVYESGLRQPRHRHDNACLTYVMQGEFTEWVVGNRTRCSRHGVLLKPPRLLHACGDCRPHTRCLTLEIPAGRLSELGQVGATWRRAWYLHGEVLWAVVLRIAQELRTDDAATSLALEGLCMDLLAEMYRLRLRERGEAPPAWLGDVVALLRTSPGDKVTLAALGELVGVSRAHLAREFRKHLGCTVGAFVRQVRLQLACELLGCPEIPLADVAIRVGFYDQSHFTNVFHQHTGQTPSAYRESVRTAAH